MWLVVGYACEVVLAVYHKSELFRLEKPSESIKTKPLPSTAKSPGVTSKWLLNPSRDGGSTTFFFA